MSSQKKFLLLLKNDIIIVNKVEWYHLCLTFIFIFFLEPRPQILSLSSDPTCRVASKIVRLAPLIRNNWFRLRLYFLLLFNIYINLCYFFKLESVTTVSKTRHLFYFLGEGWALQKESIGQPTRLVSFSMKSTTPLDWHMEYCGIYKLGSHLPTKLTLTVISLYPITVSTNARIEEPKRPYGPYSSRGDSSLP